MTTLLCSVKDSQAGMSCFDVLMRKGKLSDALPLLIYRIMQLVLVSLCKNLDISVYQFINVYGRTSSMLLLIRFVVRLNSSVFGRNTEMSIFLLQKFPQFTLFLTVCLVFGSYKYFGAFEYQKSPRFLPFWQMIPI